MVGTMSRSATGTADTDSAAMLDTPAAVSTGRLL